MEEVCPNCGKRMISFTKEVSKTLAYGDTVKFIEVPASKCKCDVYTNLLDGVKLDVYIRKNAHLPSHCIRFADIDISDEEVEALFSKLKS